MWLSCKMRCLHQPSNIYKKNISMPLPEAPLYSLQNKMASLVEMPLIFPMIQACLFGQFGPSIPIQHKHAPKSQMVKSGLVPSAIITVPLKVDRPEESQNLLFASSVSLSWWEGPHRKWWDSLLLTIFICKFYFFNKQNVWIPATPLLISSSCFGIN